MISLIANAAAEDQATLESFTQPAISARITEARYDENRLNNILTDDFVWLLDEGGINYVHQVA